MVIKRLCTVQGCQKAHQARGYCFAHYKQIRKHGKLLKDFNPVEPLPGERWEDVSVKRVDWALDAKRRARYQVSNFGRVKSIAFDRERLIKPYYDEKRKSVAVSLGRGVSQRLERLVMDHFVDNPFDERNTFYIDGDWKNCRADNLTYKGVHYRDAIIKKLKKRAAKSQDAKDILDYMQGNNEALNRILKINRAHVCEFLGWYSKDSKRSFDIESIAQETLLKAINAIKRGYLEHTKYLGQWFKVIAKNTLRMESKKMRREEMDRQYFANNKTILPLGLSGAAQWNMIPRWSYLPRSFRK